MWNKIYEPRSFEPEVHSVTSGATLVENQVTISQIYFCVAKVGPSWIFFH